MRAHEETKIDHKKGEKGDSALKRDGSMVGWCSVFISKSISVGGVGWVRWFGAVGYIHGRCFCGQTAVVASFRRSKTQFQRHGPGAGVGGARCAICVLLKELHLVSGQWISWCKDNCLYLESGCYMGFRQSIHPLSASDTK